MNKDTSNYIGGNVVRSQRKGGVKLRHIAENAVRHLLNDCFPEWRNAKCATVWSDWRWPLIDRIERRFKISGTGASLACRWIEKEMERQKATSDET